MNNSYRNTPSTAMNSNMNANMNNNMNTNMNRSEQQRLLQEIGMVDFVVVEMNEYLDTHPYDKEAINYFNYYASMKNRLMREFADKYWPLNIATADHSGNEWTWALMPQPWEGGNY